MKQLVITLPFENELECRDFLSASEHSPQWLGDAIDWEIRSLTLSTDNKNRRFVTALLDNSRTEMPAIDAITGKKLFDIIKRYPGKTVKVGFRKGLNGELHEREFANYERMFLNDNGYNTLLCSDTSYKPYNTCIDLYEHIGFTMENEDRVVTNEEAEKERAESPLALLLPGQDYAHPVAEVINENGYITLVYLQDIDIE